MRWYHNTHCALREAKLVRTLVQWSLLLDILISAFINYNIQALPVPHANFNRTTSTCSMESEREWCTSDSSWQVRNRETMQTWSIPHMVNSVKWWSGGCSIALNPISLQESLRATRCGMRSGSARAWWVFRENQLETYEPTEGGWTYQPHLSDSRSVILVESFSNRVRYVSLLEYQRLSDSSLHLFSE